MRSPWVALCLLAGGCNALLGLDDTVRADRDRDGDGVDDSVDNCPGLANPLQLPTDCVQGLICETDGMRTSLDSDRDGIDDGCDACLLGPPVDEDGDGIADACDPCPALLATSAGNRDRDGDGIGDDCDLAPDLPQTRLLFDGFNGDRLSVIWDASIEWRVGGGRIETTSLAVASVRDLQIAGDTDGTWKIETAIDLPSTAPVGAEIGIGLDFPSAPSVCGVKLAASGWALHLHTPDADYTSPVGHSGSVTLRAYLARRVVTMPLIHCEIIATDSAQSTEIPRNTAPGPFLARLYTTDAGTFRYVEIQGRR